jgi:hypothetical protein
MRSALVTETPAQAPKVKHFDASGDKKKKTELLTHSLTASVGASEGEAVKQKSEAAFLVPGCYFTT